MVQMTQVSMGGREHEFLPPILKDKVTSVLVIMITFRGGQQATPFSIMTGQNAGWGKCYWFILVPIQRENLHKRLITRQLS